MPTFNAALQGGQETMVRERWGVEGETMQNEETILGGRIACGSGPDPPWGGVNA